MLSPGRSGSESVWGVGENLGKWENRGDWATLIKSRIFKDRVRLAVFMAYLVCVCARFMFAHFKKSDLKSPEKISFYLVDTIF